MTDNFWRGYRFGLVISIILWLVILFGATQIAGAQDDITPLDCLPTLDGMAPYAIAPDLPFEATAAILSTMAGRAIWLGYDGELGPGQWQQVNWDMPDDVRPVLVIVPMAGLGYRNDHRWIMGYMAESAPGYLWLMANAKAPWDSQGHIGYHPCGSAEIVLERVGSAPALEYR